MLCSALEEACPIQLSSGGTRKAGRHQGIGLAAHRNTAVALCKITKYNMYMYYSLFKVFYHLLQAFELAKNYPEYKVHVHLT